MIGHGPESDDTNDRQCDRGLSIAITHVLTIGITTILIAMLLMSGSTLLESETERSVETSLETIGERLADEIENVDRIANGTKADTDAVNVTADHPRTVSSTGYSVTLLGNCVDAEAESPLIEDGVACLELTADDHDVVVHVPLVLETDVADDSTARGGAIEISYRADADELTIGRAD